MNANEYIYIYKNKSMINKSISFKRIQPAVLHGINLLDGNRWIDRREPRSSCRGSIGINEERNKKKQKQKQIKK